MAEVAERDDVPVPEAAAAEDEDTEERLAVVAVCVPVTEPDVVEAAAPLEVAEVADVPAQVGVVGKVTPTLCSSDSTSVHVSLSEAPSYTPNSFLSSLFCVCVVILCEGMRRRREKIG